MKKHTFKIGQKFKTLKSSKSSFNQWKKGDILILHEDDGTQNPFFINKRTNERVCCHYSRLEPIKKSPKKVTKRSVKKETYAFIRLWKVGNGVRVDAHKDNQTKEFVFNTKARLVKWLEGHI